MLTFLSLRDVALVERLDLAIGAGLTVLTGETGAGKSILLDGLGLALGERGDLGLIRAGADQATAAATFALPPAHPARALLAEQGIGVEDELILRRVLSRDGRSRAFIADQPAGVGLLRRLAELLVEIQGQHEETSLAESAKQRLLLDAYGVSAALRESVARAWTACRAAAAAREEAEAAHAVAERDREWLAHAVAELTALDPREGEEERLAAERQRLQQAEKYGEALAAALAELAPHDRRSPASALRACARILERMPRLPGAPHPAAIALAALERTLEATAEAENALSRQLGEAEADPHALERNEERLFALRAAARKHLTTVAELPSLREALSARLTALETGSERLAAFRAAQSQAEARYRGAAGELSAARGKAARRLEQALVRELPPLKLGRTNFAVVVAPALSAGEEGPHGADRVRFLIATNPGTEPGPLERIASGGELSRLMLALKVVLAGASPATTLIFDEVDSGIGGATAAAVGERLARIAETTQILVVTHSPQVAARGTNHLSVIKTTARNRVAIRVEQLEPATRREEIARMLAGSRVTDAARAAADSLLLGSAA